MKFGKKTIGVLFAGVLAFVFLTAESCDSTAQDKVGQQRQDKINSVTLCGAKNQSTECSNIAEKLKRDNNPNQVTYVYLFSFGQPIGYFVARGKVSSTQSQMGPMDFGINACPDSSWNYKECYQVAEAPGDDGSYGPNESGIFFFTADGKMIRWNDTYLQVDAPLDLPGARQLYAK